MNESDRDRIASSQHPRRQRRTGSIAGRRRRSRGVVLGNRRCIACNCAGTTSSSTVPEDGAASGMHSDTRASHRSSLCNALIELKGDLSQQSGRDLRSGKLRRVERTNRRGGPAAGKISGNVARCPRWRRIARPHRGLEIAADFARSERIGSASALCGGVWQSGGT